MSIVGGVFLKIQNKALVDSLAARRWALSRTVMGSMPSAADMT